MLRRKTPLKADPEKTRAWQQRSRKRLPVHKKTFNQRSKKRAKQEREYNSEINEFLREHPVCPVTGERTTQIHHSAKREGEWLNLKRYWIAVNQKGHRWIEDNKGEAENMGLMVRIYVPYRVHFANLLQAGINPDVPVYYENHPV